MWNPKEELVKKDTEVANSKEVYDSLSVTRIKPLVAKKIRTMEDVNNIADAALISLYI